MLYGASPGNFGTVRGQRHLREILAALNVFVLPQPQVFLARAQEAFNEEGLLKDIRYSEQLKNLIKLTLEMAREIE